MTLQLYEICEELNLIHDELVENDGELTPEIEQLLDELEMGAEQKIEEMCKFIRAAEYEADVRRLEAAKQAKGAKTLEKSAAVCKKIVIEYLRIAGHKFMRTGMFKATRCAAPPQITVVRAEEVPEEAWIPIPDELSRSLLRDWYKEHGEVPGCEITQKESLRIT